MSVSPAPTLNRSLGLTWLTFYGLGTVLGAGIYVLIGAVVAEAGRLAPWSFVLAGAVAAMTAFSYGELARRLPVSAGEAAYVQAGLRRADLSRLTGWLVVLVGLVSAATIANGMVGYARQLVPLPGELIKLGVLLSLGGVAAWGIRVSAGLAVLLTLAEIGGLGLVLLSALLADPSAPEPVSMIPARPPLVGVCLGAFLAFYAFIGFEDMVNVAEEVREPERVLPLSILLVLVVSVSLYVAVVVAALWVLPPSALAHHDAPLAAVVGRSLPGAVPVISLISVVAVINGALVQIIMASRVLYGMGRRGLAPSWLSAVHPRTRTPLRATVVVTAVIVTLALTLPLVRLAQITSFITLGVFLLVNASLIALQRRDAGSLPRAIPVLGVLLSLGLLVTEVLLRLWH